MDNQQNTNLIYYIKLKLKTEYIDCIKYNHSFEQRFEQVQNYDSQLYLSQDEKEIVLMNKRYENPFDPENQRHKPIVKGFQTDAYETNTKFSWSKSSASFKVNDITGIIFGGFSSRFWALRKQMNLINCRNMNDKQMQINIPFYSWQCVTIQTKDRDVDLVIQNDEEMKRLLNFISYEMNKLNQNKVNSAFLDELKKNGICCVNEVNHQMMFENSIKYNILRIRAKISFMAFTKHLTI